MSEETCQVVVINSSNVDLAESLMPEDRVLIQMTETLKLLTDPTRLKILNALAVAELCVCDLSVLLDKTSSAISHQLKLLRTYGLVKFRREGKIAYYSLSGDSTRKLLTGVAQIQPISESG